MKRHADRVSDAECENLRLVVGLIHKRIVGWHRAVLREPKDLAAVLIRVLGP